MQANGMHEVRITVYEVPTAGGTAAVWRCLDCAHSQGCSSYVEAARLAGQHEGWYGGLARGRELSKITSATSA